MLTPKGKVILQKDIKRRKVMVDYGMKVMSLLEEDGVNVEEV